MIPRDNVDKCSFASSLTPAARACSTRRSRPGLTHRARSPACTPPGVGTVPSWPDGGIPGLLGSPHAPHHPAGPPADNHRGQCSGPAVSLGERPSRNQRSNHTCAPCAFSANRAEPRHTIRATVSSIHQINHKVDRIFRPSALCAYKLRARDHPGMYVRNKSRPTPSDRAPGSDAGRDHKPSAPGICPPPTAPLKRGSLAGLSSARRLRGRIPLVDMHRPECLTCLRHARFRIRPQKSRLPRA